MMRFLNNFWWPDNVTDKDSMVLSCKQTGSLIKLLKEWPKNRRNVVVQAGGSYGMWPRILSKQFKLVHTFEPEPLSFEALMLNCPEKNVIKTQKALGDKETSVWMARKRAASHYVMEKEFDQLRRKHPDHMTQVESITIDYLGLKDCDGILLDVERWEYCVLIGAIQTIRKYKPLILIERGEKHGGSVDELLRRLDYKLIKPIGHDILYAYEGIIK